MNYRVCDLIAALQKMPQQVEVGFSNPLNGLFYPIKNVIKDGPAVELVAEKVD